MEDFFTNCQTVVDRMEAGLDAIMGCKNVRRIESGSQDHYDSIKSIPYKTRIDSFSKSDSALIKKTSPVNQYERLKLSKSFSGTSSMQTQPIMKKAVSFRDKFISVSEEANANRSALNARIYKAKSECRDPPEPSLALIISGSGRNPRKPHVG